MANPYSNPGNPAHDREVNRYYEAIIALALLLIAGRITRSQFTARQIELTETAIIAGIIMAGGILTDGRVVDFLRQQQKIGVEATRQLADDLQAGKFTSSDEMDEATALQRLRNRLALWTFTAGGSYVVGQLVRPPTLVNLDDEILEFEPHYDWIYGATELHCSTCAGSEMAGVQPRSYWDRRPQPQSPDLDCGGWRCDCWYRDVPIEEVLKTQIL